MKKWSVAFTVMMTVMFTAAMPVHAKGDKIESGIYANDMDLSGMTAQEAVQALANYIYEFVEQVEPMALEEPGAQVWLLSSPTGISGTAALDEETDQLFRFTYRDEEGGEPLCYTVDKTDGKVLFLEQEPSN